MYLNPSPIDVLAVIQDSWNPNFECPRGLLSLNGHTIFEEIISRISRVKEIGLCVLATSRDPKDDDIASLAGHLGIEVFRGDSKDVLSRIMEPIRKFQPETIVRIPGSSPLVDVDNLKRMLELHARSRADLTTTENHKCIVHGMGAEVIRSSVLEEISAVRLTPFQREFHTQYIKQNPTRYRVVHCPSDMPRPRYSVSIGNRKDYILVKEVEKRLGRNIHEQSVVKLLDENPHLTEINAHEQVKEIGLEKIILFPDKIKEISRVASNELEVDATYPVSVELSLTDACQLKCIWCSDYCLRSRDKACMNTERVKLLLNDLKSQNTRGIVIEGGGEPTLHPDFESIVEYAHGLGLSLGLITNGIRSLSEEAISRFDWIRVSLDASTAEEFLELKKSDGFDTVMNNLDHMTGVGPVIGVGYVLTKRNYERLEDLIYSLQKIGIDYLHVRPVVDRPELAHHGDMSYLSRITYQQFPLILDPLQENAEKGNGGLPCMAHVLTSVISSSGDVYICGRLNIYPWCRPIGNIGRSSFSEIWLGEERRKQALQLRDPAFCSKYCPQCRITKYNKLFDQQAHVRTRNFI